MNMEKMNKTPAVFIALLPILLFILKPVQPVMAEGISLGIKPQLVEITSQSGQTLSYDFTLRSSLDPVMAETKIQPFVPGGHNGEIDLIDCGHDQRSVCEIAKWIKIEPEYYYLTDNQNIKLTLTIPNKAVGDYYFSLMTTVKPAEMPKGKSGMKTALTVGAQVLLSVARNNKLERLVGEPKLDFDGQKLTVMIVNEGENYFKVSGNVTISNILGLKTSINLPDVRALSYSRRNLSARYPDNLLPGRYHLTAVVKIADAGQELKAGKTVWIMPDNRGLAVTGAVMIILFAGVIFLLPRLRASSQNS